MTLLRSASTVVFVALLASPAKAQILAPERFTVMSDGHPMAVWARLPAAPTSAVLLVHGRTWSSRPDFDLQVPGLQRSVMMSFVAKGIAAYAVDLRGYGETPRDATGWMTPNRSALDLANVLDWVAGQHPGLAKPVLVGWSRGAAISMLAAQQTPDRIRALVLFGFAFDPAASFADSDQPAVPARARNTAEAAASDFISPKITSPAVIRAFVAQAMTSDPILADLKNDGEFNQLSPSRVSMPTLVIYGDRDPGVTKADAQKFLATLGTSQKQLVVLPGADHAAHLESTHDLWMSSILTFIARGTGRR